MYAYIKKYIDENYTPGTVYIPAHFGGPTTTECIIIDDEDYFDTDSTGSVYLFKSCGALKYTPSSYVSCVYTPAFGFAEIISNSNNILKEMIYRQGSGYVIKKSNGHNLGLRRGEWYLIDSDNPRIFQYSNMITSFSDNLIIGCSTIHTKSGISVDNTHIYYKDDDEIDKTVKTEMNSLLDIMFYKTDKLK